MSWHLEKGVSKKLLYCVNFSTCYNTLRFYDFRTIAYGGALKKRISYSPKCWRRCPSLKAVLVIKLFKTQVKWHWRMCGSQNAFGPRYLLPRRHVKLEMIHQIGEKQEKFHSSELRPQTHPLPDAKLRKSFWNLKLAFLDKPFWFKFVRFRVCFWVDIHFVDERNNVCAGRNCVVIYFPFPKAKKFYFVSNVIL